MTISSPEREAKKVKIAVDRNPVETSFEKWAGGLKKGYDIFYNFCIFIKFLKFFHFYFLFINFLFVINKREKTKN
jgi:hypothetical protein